MLKKAAPLLTTLAYYFSVISPVLATDEPAGVKQAQQLLTRLINIVGGLAFIALTVVLILAGIKFLTSGGDKNAISQAQSAITWALLGIFFLALAFIILQLIKVFTGVDVTKFSLNFPSS